MIHDDDHARKLLDQEDDALYRKVCKEAWLPLPAEYKKHGKKRWAYNEQKKR